MLIAFRYKKAWPLCQMEVFQDIAWTSPFGCDCLASNLVNLVIITDSFLKALWLALAGTAQLAGASSCYWKVAHFNSQSGHMLKFQAWFWLDPSWGSLLVLLSRIDVSLFPLPFLLNYNKINLQKKIKGLWLHHRGHQVSFHLRGWVCNTLCSVLSADSVPGDQNDVLFATPYLSMWKMQL